MEETAVVHRVQPVQPNEECDSGRCPALASVAILIPVSNDSSGRLTFCAHHYNDLPYDLKVKILARTN